MSVMNHLMIDLETIGNTYNSAIVTVGACFFDPETGEIGPKFYRAVDWADAIRHGRVDGETLKWWMQQSDEARAAAVQGKESLADVLNSLADFYNRGRNARPWGNGATFDITILEHAYLRCLGRKAPWDFWNIRDVRTIVDVASGICDRPKTFGKGTAHNALDDAVFQAEYVSKMWQALRGAKAAAPKSSEPAATNLDLDI